MLAIYAYEGFSRISLKHVEVAVMNETSTWSIIIFSNSYKVTKLIVESAEYNIT